MIWISWLIPPVLEQTFGKGYLYNIYIRLFLKYGAKILSQTQVMRIQSWWDCISAAAGDFGTVE